jgi:hypothetical protein
MARLRSASGHWRTSIVFFINRIGRVLSTTGLVIALVVGCGADDQVSTEASESTIATISSTSHDPKITLETSSSTSTTRLTSSPPKSTVAPFTASLPIAIDSENFQDSVTVPAGEIDVGSDDLFVVHTDGDLWLRPRMPSGSPAQLFRIADLGEPRDPVEEGPGPNEVESVAGVFNGTVVYSDCCETIAGNVLSATRADSERIHLPFGYTPTLSPDRMRLATANSYTLTVTELSTGARSGRVLNNEDPYINVWDVSWTNDSSLVLLYFDDDGFALLPFGAHSLLGSASSAPLGVAFDPDTPVQMSFAGHGPDGEIALTVTDETSTLIRFFDPATLAAMPDQQRDFPRRQGVASRVRRCRAAVDRRPAALVSPSR